MTKKTTTTTPQPDLEKLLVRNKPIKCPTCGGKLYYSGIGNYQCRDCDHVIMDDYGKVRHFIEENGPATALTIAKETGVDSEIVTLFLEAGKIGIPEGSKYFLSCQKCGCSLRFGRYCADCSTSLANGIKTEYHADTNKKDVFVNPHMKGKIHFLGDKRKK